MTDDLEHDQFVDAIAADVLAVLTQKGFFESLDDVFSPRDGSSTSTVCQGDYAISERILGNLKFDEQDLSDIFQVLRSRGGFCDCEILYNAVETSRLKANYWRARADDASVPNPHDRRLTR
jgi:hypothetical protein